MSILQKRHRAGLYIATALFFFWFIVGADTTSALYPVSDGTNDSADWSTQGGASCASGNCAVSVSETSGGTCTNSDGDTTYITSSTDGARQTFLISLASVPDGATVTNIAVSACAVRTQGGAKIQTTSCVNGTCTNSGSDIILGTSYSETTQNHAVSFVKGAGSTAQIGVLNSASKGVRISQVKTVLTYTTPDTTAPSAISNLSSTGTTQTSISLTWTAPGDDGNTGTATTYDLRYSTSAITAGNFSSATQATGEPTPSSAGSSESMTVSGLSADTTYFFALKTSDEVPNTSAISNVLSVGTSATPNIQIPTGGTSEARAVIFAGQVYPKAHIEVLRSDTVNPDYINIPIERETISEDGTFRLEFIALLGGDYLFALKAIDPKGRKTGVLSFAAKLLTFNTVRALDIFFPPTVGFQKSTINRGELVSIEGYAAPKAEVALYVDGAFVASTTALATGEYTYALATKTYALGTHTVRARQLFGAPTKRLSALSSSRSFRLSTLSLPEADLNSDNVISITDWSIFLFRWASSDTSLKKSVDFNNDGIVSIADFSIFLKALRL